MYGTVAHVRVKEGHGEALKSLVQEWNLDRKPKVKGAGGGYMFKLDRDPQDWVLIGLFEDKKTYEANADDPEQDKWFRRIMEHLEDEPQWHDGEAYET